MSTDPNNQDFLSKVSAAERAELLGTLAAMPGIEVEIATTDGKSFKAKGSALKGSVMELDRSQVPGQVKPGQVGASFVVNLSKYLIKSSLQWTEEGRWFLDLRGDIFLVQRRKNFRIETPVQVVSRVVIRLINRPEKDFQAKMLNISLGGCFLEVDGSTVVFQREAQVQLTIFLEANKSLELPGVVRRVSRSPEDPHKYFMGIEFSKLNGFEESRVNEIVMKCYRLVNRFGTRRPG